MEVSILVCVSSDGKELEHTVLYQNGHFKWSRWSFSAQGLGSVSGWNENNDPRLGSVLSFWCQTNFLYVERELYSFAVIHLLESD